MKAVLIDSVNKVVSDVEYDGDYRSIYALINCQAFDVVALPSGDDCWIDDEGLLSLTDESPFFIYDGRAVYAGSGLILGSNHDTGDSTDAGNDASYYRPLISFTTRGELAQRGLAPEPGFTVMAFSDWLDWHRGQMS